jgi:hypothetical protein
MTNQEHSRVHELGAFSSDAMLADFRDLRLRLIGAWRERAVMLTPEEQGRLRQEIIDTCALLTELTK